MAVMKCKLKNGKDGFKAGTTGTCLPTRTEAVKQMGAIKSEQNESKEEMISEFVSNKNARLSVENDGGLIHGIKIIGLESKNGRSYPTKVLESAIEKYENVRVNVDHSQDPKKPRSYTDRMGIIKHVMLKEDGLYGDFYYNPQHPMAKQLEWDAINAPQNVGFSHVIQGKVKKQNGKVVIEEIRKVQSVDLVADPATTQGLFESEVPTQEEGTNMDDVTLDKLKTERPDLVTAISESAISDHADSEEQKAKQKKIEENLSTLEKENKQLKEDADKAKKEIAFKALIESSGVDPEKIDEKMLEHLKTVDEETAKMLLENMKVGVSSNGKPKSTEQNAKENIDNKQAKDMDTKTFVESIT